MALSSISQSAKLTLFEISSTFIYHLANFTRINIHLLSMTEKNITTTWWVYFLRCSDNSLYAGVTTDIHRRVDEHNNSKLGAKYTRARRPVRLAYLESAASKSLACKREYQIRHLSKHQKEQLVSQYCLK